MKNPTGLGPYSPTGLGQLISPRGFGPKGWVRLALKKVLQEMISPAGLGPGGWFRLAIKRPLNHLDFLDFWQNSHSMNIL